MFGLLFLFCLCFILFYYYYHYYCFVLSFFVFVCVYLFVCLFVCVVVFLNEELAQYGKTRGRIVKRKIMSCTPEMNQLKFDKLCLILVCCFFLNCLRHFQTLPVVNSEFSVSLDHK